MENIQSKDAVQVEQFPDTGPFGAHSIDARTRSTFPTHTASMSPRWRQASRLSPHRLQRQMRLSETA